MLLSWKHGPIIAGVVAVGLAGTVIFAQLGGGDGRAEPPTKLILSDDLYQTPEPLGPPANAPANTPSANAAPAPANGAPPAEASLVEEPSDQAVQPLATYVCRNRNGSAGRPIQCDGRRTVHARLTVALKQKLQTSAIFTLEEYQDEARFTVGSAPARATGRYVRVKSDIDVRAAKGAVLRITYTAPELRAWNVAAKKLAIAAYDTATERWIVLPSLVNQRSRFVQASFATKRLPDQLFALVARP